MDGLSKLLINGNPVLSAELVDLLFEYMAFRHRFRHAYTMNLDPDVIAKKTYATAFALGQNKAGASYTDR